ncbi:hypothetical protein XMM354_003271 [Aliiroseovarius sp. xm-m-354]|nr:hypothetical protein [Aliiroseovarius sp. xm-m-354]
MEEGRGLAALISGVFLRVSDRVFSAVQCVFEWTIGAGNPVVAFGRHVEPAFGIVLGQRPFHDVEALVDRARFGNEAGDSGTGGGFEEGPRFVPQNDFAQVDGRLPGSEGETGSHGVGTAAEGVEDWGHGV